MFSRLLRHRYGKLTTFLLLVAGLIALPILLYPGSRSDNNAPSSAIHVTIDRSSSIGTSQFATGLTHVDGTLDGSDDHSDLEAIQRVKGLIKQAITYQATPIMAWGGPDPWPDPAQSEPGDWSYLDGRLKLILDTGGIPVITLCEAPWWMKGILQSDGSTRLLTASEEWDDDAYSARVLDNKMDAWLHLVQRVAERYMVAPYNVRYFQVWNELKGYYNPVTKLYDYNNSPGNPTKAVANHGYTYMYNQVYQRLMQVARSRGIATSAIKIGGPYVSLSTVSSAEKTDWPAHLVKSYGVYDQRYLDVIQYWLQHKVGASFITLDSANKNDDDVNIADPFTAAETFADVVTWVRSLNPVLYPGATTLPIWWAEWYASPYTQPTDDHCDAAIKTYAMIKLLKAGGAVVFSWGGVGDDEYDTGLWTTTTTDGGQPHSWYFAYKAFKDYFAPGTEIYRTTVSAPKEIEVLASATKLMLVNKTPRTVVVAVAVRSKAFLPGSYQTSSDKTISLSPYQVSVADY